MISPAPAGQIFMKFDVEDYYENLWRNSKFGEVQTNISDILHEEQKTLFYCRRNKFAIKIFFNNNQNFSIIDSDK
jgi:hypothetical protein